MQTLPLRVPVVKSQDHVQAGLQIISSGQLDGLVCVSTHVVGCAHRSLTLGFHNVLAINLKFIDKTEVNVFQMNKSSDRTLRALGVVLTLMTF